MAKKVTREDIRKVANQYILDNPSSVFELNLVDINNDSGRYPCWSVIFEMRNKDGNLVDGPLVLGIDEFGEIIMVG
ncbi:hypothetical protein [Paenibacillus sp. FSL K6-1230]|uniref:hypothetical protein n=1 Tax=Paenibacillus sp. FSL K6-1230 TaxID=2921603 RepID=UPI0030FA4374